MSNLKTLSDFRNLTPEQMKEHASKAGKKSGEARRRKKSLRERLQLLLESKNTEGVTNHELICVSMIEKAIKGDAKAFELVRDTIGEKPIEKISNRIGTAKNGGLKIILLGEDGQAKRDSNKTEN